MLNSYYLHFAFFIAIVTMPKHASHEYAKLLQSAQLPDEDDPDELC